MATLLMARLGIMRLGRSRLGRYPPPPISVGATVLINGVNKRTRIAGLSITDELNHEPDNASFRTDGSFLPIAGQEIQISLGSLQLFGGHLLSTDQLYELKPANLACDCGAIEYSWLLKRRPVLTKYTNQSATAIVKDLVATFASGFTTNNVAPDLPVIDEITFTHEDLPDAITRVMARVGGYWRQELKDIYAFLTETDMAGPITQASPRTMRHIRQKVDLSQIATRVRARGGGGQAVADIAAGEAILPVDDASWYPPFGTIEVGAESQFYNSVILGGAGALVGTGFAPTSAPIAMPTSGANLTAGVYLYAAAFVTTAGETVPGPLASVTVASGTKPQPPAPTVFEVAVRSYGVPPAGTYRWTIEVWYYGGTHTQLSLPTTFTAGGYWQLRVRPAASIWADPTVQFINIYRTVAGGSTPLGLGSVTGPYDLYDGSMDGSLGAGSTNTNTTVASLAAALSVIPISSNPNVTARKVYRTVANGSALKLLTTIANNTGTTYSDTTVVDGSLGAAAPTVDTSGLTVAGQLPVGATTIPVTNTTPFAVGGYAWLGSQLVRFTGVGAGVLTGVPSSGPGSIAATVPYGHEIILAAQLRLPATTLRYAVRKSDPINLLVVVDDLPAQAAMAAYVGSGDGVHEMFITDGRWSIAEATANALTELTQRKDPHVTITFESRDRTIVAGRSIFIHTTTPAIGPITVKIQRVTFSEIGLHEGTWPLRTVECSSHRRSFEDLLRDIRKAA